MKLLCLIISLLVSVKNEIAAYNSDDIVFPGESSRTAPLDNRNSYRPMGRDLKDDFSEIPLDLIQRLNEEVDISTVIQKYVDGVPKEFGSFELSERFGNSERAAATIAKPATCMPTLQEVELKPTNDSTKFYIPSCTRVPRCGGCCSSSLLSCQPTQTETVSFQVIATQYGGGMKLRMTGKEIAVVEQHVKCKCNCVVKQEDCNLFQEYRPQECRCICKNTDEKKKCEKSNNTMLWDPITCKCVCREVTECTTGSLFDHTKCGCVRIPLRRRFAELNSTKERPFTDDERYEIVPLSVLPLSKKTKTGK